MMSVMKRLHAVKFRILFSFLIVSLAVMGIGWFFTGNLVDLARRSVINDGENASLIVSLHLTNELKRIEGAVEALAGSPLIFPALLSRSPSDIEKANSALERYQSALGASVCYLMDITGLTIASSNRNTRESFVGQSYDFRPYFKQALAGGKGLYFALGVTSGERGVYASFPVRSADGRVLGVVAMKRNLGDLEKELPQYQWCLVDRNGIIFISSNPEMRLKSLQPLDTETASRLILSRAFGPGPFQPFLQKEMQDGSEVIVAGSQYLVTRHFTEYDGWSVILLWPTKQIGIYRAFGITLTLLTCFLFTAFLTIIYIFKQSADKIRESEFRFRELFNRMGSGVVVYEARDNGNDFIFRDINLAGEWLSKVKREDMIGKSVLNAFPGIKNLGLFDVFQRVFRSGAAEHHPVSLYKDQRIAQWVENEVYKLPSGEVVAIYEDITVRRQTEQEQLRLTDEIRLLLQSTGEGIYGTDTNGLFTFINRAGAAMLGFSPEELIGKPSHAVVHHSHADGSVYPSEECPMNRTLQSGQECRMDNEVLWRKDGTSFLVELSCHPMVHGGETKGVVVTFSDITERKRSEAALEEERRRLQKALEDVRTLRGIVPICASCKKIRDDKGFWNQVEKYVGEHSEAEFSHGICPQCIKKLYPEFFDDESVLTQI